MDKTTTYELLFIQMEMLKLNYPGNIVMRIYFKQNNIRKLLELNLLIVDYGIESLLFFHEHFKRCYSVLPDHWKMSASLILTYRLKLGFHIAAHIKPTSNSSTFPAAIPHPPNAPYLFPGYGWHICNHQSDHSNFISNLTSAFDTHGYPFPLL